MGFEAPSALSAFSAPPCPGRLSELSAWESALSALSALEDQRRDLRLNNSYICCAEQWQDQFPV